MGGNTDICDMFNAQYNSSSHLYHCPPPVEWIMSMKCVTGLQSSGDTGNNRQYHLKIVHKTKEIVMLGGH